jgi:hypothetical protein
MEKLRKCRKKPTSWPHGTPIYVDKRTEGRSREPSYHFMETQGYSINLDRDLKSEELKSCME